MFSISVKVKKKSERKKSSNNKHLFLIVKGEYTHFTTFNLKIRTQYILFFQ